MTAEPTASRPVHRYARPRLIGCLNALLAAPGYFLIEQWQKGLAAILLVLIVGIPTCGLGIPVVLLLAGADGFMQAAHLRAGRSIGRWTFFNRFSDATSPEFSGGGSSAIR